MKTRRRSAGIARVGLTLFLLAGMASAQAKVSARLSSGVVRLGETASLSVVVENGEGARIVEVPKVEGLELGKPGRPNSQQFTSYVNGRLYSQVSLSWTLSLRAEAEGDFEIPPIAVEVNGQRILTQPLHLTVAVDIQGEDLGYLELHPSSEKVVEGQPFTVEMLFGWDASTEVNFVELNLPWWDSLPGAIELEAQQIPREQRVEGISVNREIEVAAEQREARQRGGRTFHTLRITKTYLPTRAGKLEFPTSFFEFGRRRQSSIFDPRPARRESHFVQAAPFSVEVVALPSAGQPLDFSGAVGALSARASADTRDVRVGDSIKLTVEWTGAGNLEFFRPPDPGELDAFRGFRVYGSTEEKSFERRKVTYDISPLSTEVKEIPPLALSAFDPASNRYESVSTAAIPIRVRALEKAAGLESDERRFERDIADIDPRALEPRSGNGDPSGRDGLLAGLLLGVPLVGYVARARLRRRSGDPGAPLERRRRRARRTLARALARAAGPEAELAAFLEFLGARTREGPEAWQGRDVARWARSEARVECVPAELLGRTAQLLGGLESAVWGGGAPAGKDALLELARALEEAGL